MDPVHDPERRMSAHRKRTPAEHSLTAALYSLKEDAMFAFKESLGGTYDTLPNVGRAWANVQAAVQALDQEKKQS